MNLYHRFISEVFAITTAGAVQFQSRFSYSAPATARAGTNFFGDTIRQLEFQNNVAIIPVDGALVKGAGFLDVGCGARAHETISDDLSTALSKSPKAIVLNVASPGGTVNGTAELGSQISAAAKRIPVYAFTDSMAASAAYWLASGATKIFTTSTAQTGSIGAVLQVASFARALEAAGVDLKVFTSAGAGLKATGNPYKVMTDADAAYLQERANQCADMFTEAVFANRPQVKEGALNGATFFAADGLKLGLIDGVVSSLGEVIGMAGGSGGGSSARSHLAAQSSEFVSAEHQAAYERGVASGRVKILTRESHRYTLEDFKAGKIK